MTRPALTASLASVLVACSSASPAPPACPDSVDDGVACTVDECDPSTGAVSHVPTDALCPAGAACSPSLGCVAGAVTCDDVPRAAGTAVALRPVLAGLSSPVHVTAPRGDARRLFVVEQAGRIRVAVDGVLEAEPYLDVSGRVLSGGERGLLSLAFDPAFSSNGRLYVNYTDATGDVVVSRFTAPDPVGNAADPGSEVRLLAIGHRAYANHNGGLVAFGPDGLLYVSVGDGGGGGDPLRTGQDTSSLLGKLLRIDPDDPGRAVAGNPFGNAVYHYGLRNPWRWSFDRATGDLYVGDVGQGAREEIDFAAAAAPGSPPAAGTNWGWSAMEGNLCYADSACAQRTDLVRPILDYGRVEGRSVVGGHVYRGVALPDLAATGAYFFGDSFPASASSFLRTLRVVNGQATDVTDVSATLGVPLLVSFGEDGCGELHLVAYGGTVSKLVPAP